MSAVTCTIIITSYNSAEFIAATVESAINQDYPAVRVIIVDDGSKDDSLEILARYAHRVTIISKRNGGQASAFNAGFAIADSDIVFFLDGDDTLLPTTVTRVVAAWNPSISKVHFKLQRMRRNGTPIDGNMLPPYRALLSGDMTPLVRRFGFYPSPPTSGNAFSRSYLDHIMPMDEEPFRNCADTLLLGLAPMFGEIAALPGIGGYWRYTGKNASSGGLPIVAAMAKSEDVLVSMYQRLSTRNGDTHKYAALSPQYLKHRLILRKFSPSGTRVGESLTLLLVAYWRTVSVWPGYNLATRVKFIIWGGLMGVVPSRLLKQIPGIAGGAVTL